MTFSYPNWYSYSITPMSVLKGVVVPSKVKVLVFLYTDANLNKSIEDF